MIELIPVIEINQQDLKEELIPYSEGMPFYSIADISDNILAKLTIDHTQGIRDGEYEREQASPFFGGYVLNINGEDKYFPQCCGDLSDIYYWEQLSNGVLFYNEGHPSPDVTIKDNNIIFDFTVKGHDEFFQPTPPEIILTVDCAELKKAVDKVKEQLIILKRKLEQINETEHLNIENIGGLLLEKP